MPYLASTPIINWHHPTVRAQAELLAVPGDLIATARACFEFVRDEIQHSRDFERNPTTCRASDVLHHRTGYCYAKSHLLAALFRANGLRAGFCYQRLSVNDSGPPYSLHGFNAVDLPIHGWYRLDPAATNQASTPPSTHPTNASPSHSSPPKKSSTKTSSPSRCQSSSPRSKTAARGTKRFETCRT